MRTITDLRTWKGKDGEFRVYVTFEDKSEGCLYHTGNRYQAKGTLTNMTIEEKLQALAISEKKHGVKIWGAVRYWEINPETSKVINSNNYYKKVDEENSDIKSRGFRESRTPDFEQCFA